MRQNPVYSREMKVSARSPRFPLILSLFNGILCLAALINMYSVVLRVRTNATIQYSSFMDLYEFVTSMEFIIINVYCSGSNCFLLSAGSGNARP